MSFSLTTPQFKARTKTVTRRLGWSFLKPGDIVMGVEKAMGLKKGEKLVRLGAIKIISNKPEILGDMRRVSECVKEGFPNLSVPQFVQMFCNHMGVEESAMVNRIEFEYL